MPLMERYADDLLGRYADDLLRGNADKTSESLKKLPYTNQVPCADMMLA